MRRKAGALVPLELAILDAAAARGAEPFHGFELARALAEGDGARGLTAHGTLYKALGRLAEQGLLESEWEDPDRAARDGRPRRRLYRLTGDGERRLATERRERPSVSPGPAAGLA
jgi:PadR family transcriptional regulator, regulatory protein PadR